MKNKNQILTIAIVVLMLAFLVLTFLPYYTIDGVEYSISGTVWIYTTTVKTYFQAAIDGFKANNNTQYAPQVLMFVGAIVLIVLEFLKNRSLLTQVVAVLWALVTTIGLLVNKMLPLGNQSVFYAMLGVSIVADILILIGLIGWIQEYKAKPKKKKHH